MACTGRDAVLQHALVRTQIYDMHLDTAQTHSHVEIVDTFLLNFTEPA